MTPANGLTLSRLGIAGGFVACLAIAAQNPVISGPWAALLIAIAVVEEATDIFDGWLARKTGTASELGGILDPQVATQ